MLGLLLAYVVAAASVVVWTVRQARAVPLGDPDEAAAGLRRAVRLQWNAEVGARQLEQPRPLRLRWRSTARPVAVTISGPDGSGQRLAGELVQDTVDPRPLARRVYRAPGTNPRELTELPTAHAVQHHLLDRFLPTVYSTPRAAVHAERWLAFLAHHLRERVSDPNLEWWHLAQAVPRLVITTLVAGALTCLGALFGLATGAVLSATDWMGELWWATLVGTIAGWSLGVLAGLHAGRSAHPQRLPAAPGWRLTTQAPVIAVLSG